MCGLHSVLVGQTESFNSLQFNSRSCKFFSALACWFPDQLELERELLCMLVDTGGDAHCKFSSILNGWELRVDLGVGILWFWLSLLKSSRQPDGYQTLCVVVIGEVLGSDCKQPTA